MVAIIKELEAVGLIEVELGREGILTRIRATRQLQHLFRDLKFPILEVTFGYMEETIILRDAPEDTDEKDARKTKRKRKKPNLEYDDTPETIRMRGVLNKYNELLNKSRLDVFSLEVSYIDRNVEKGERAGDNVRIYIDHRNTFVKRVFNNASWESGGRFYGGWWQHINEELRSDIMINDNPVVEIDFTAMHIALLQAQVAQKLEPNLVVVKGSEPQQKSNFFQKFSASRLINTDDAPNTNHDPYTLNKTIFPYKNDFDLWRAVDHEGEVLESYVTKKRDKKAALKFMKKAMRRYGAPNEIVTDKLRSYNAAAKELGCLEKQVTGRWANNRVENSHLPFRR
jgi:IS1 family transposase